MATFSTNQAINKKMLTLFGSLAFSWMLTACTEKAQEPNNSQQINPANSDRVHSKGSPIWDRSLIDKFSDIRVKIFPHNGRYAIPQGREKIQNHIQFSSSGSCVLYYATKNTSEDGITRDKIAAEGRQFSFSAEKFDGPYWLECNRPTTLVRDDYPQFGIAYEGVFFIKKVTPAAGAPYLVVVNTISFESYLKGVIPTEMPAYWHMEALKAQSVAARTYALFELGSNIASEDKELSQERSGAQLDDTVSYQAYLGTFKKTVRTDAAVEATRGEVVIYEGKVIKAFFHADSGGYTEDSENLWGVYYPYIRAKKEIYPEGAVPDSSWVVKSSLANIQKELENDGLLASGSSLTDVYIDKKDILTSGRPKWIMAKLSDSSLVRIFAADVAYALNLKSSWISFGEASPSSGLALFGKGFGHGAGMSQWGARLMSENLKNTYQEILTFYYSGVSVVK